ncbi:hypothetical protein BLNAU_3561 [Blattamonas nauphoetae]|uniref:Uncharacterized protein n=1 Tax=Blattamonas nauphoetae TaxID=2049346 RepID=A0ABQ9YCJ1_9EUKA|nr:hypothetical protein BLNAU_3561 [Blattamonas nauphoetae]
MNGENAALTTDQLAGNDTVQDVDNRSGISQNTDEQFFSAVLPETQTDEAPGETERSEEDNSENVDGSAKTSQDEVQDQGISKEEDENQGEGFGYGGEEENEENEGKEEEKGDNDDAHSTTSKKSAKSDRYDESILRGRFPTEQEENEGSETVQSETEDQNRSENPTPQKAAHSPRASRGRGKSNDFRPKSRAQQSRPKTTTNSRHNSSNRGMSATSGNSLNRTTKSLSGGQKVRRYAHNESLTQPLELSSDNIPPPSLPKSRDGTAQRSKSKGKAKGRSKPKNQETVTKREYDEDSLNQAFELKKEAVDRKKTVDNDIKMLQNRLFKLETEANEALFRAKSFKRKADGARVLRETNRKAMEQKEKANLRASSENTQLGQQRVAEERDKRDIIKEENERRLAEKREAARRERELKNEHRQKIKNFRKQEEDVKREQAEAARKALAEEKARREEEQKKKLDTTHLKTLEEMEALEAEEIERRKELEEMRKKEQELLAKLKEAYQTEDEAADELESTLDGFN